MSMVWRVKSEIETENEDRSRRSSYLFFTSSSRGKEGTMSSSDENRLKSARETIDCKCIRPFARSS